jgi:hypothetical protein
MRNCWQVQRRNRGPLQSGSIRWISSRRASAALGGMTSHPNGGGIFESIGVPNSPSHRGGVACHSQTGLTQGSPDGYQEI